MGFFINKEIDKLNKELCSDGNHLKELAALAPKVGQLMAEELKFSATTPFDHVAYANFSLNSITASDVEHALLHIRWAWNDHGPCTQFFLCLTYIDSAGISFSDGNFGVFVNIQRLTTSAHDCIVNAKKAKSEGNKAMAVQWVIASQIHNRSVYDWLKGHGDAVITALDMVP